MQLESKERRAANFFKLSEYESGLTDQQAFREDMSIVELLAAGDKTDAGELSDAESLKGACSQARRR